MVAHLFWLVPVLGSVLIVGIAYPMYTARIRRNFWYGYRTPRALADDESWYAANRLCGRDLIVGGLTSVLLIILSLPIAWRIGVAGLFLPIGVMACLTLGALAHSVWRIEWVEPRSMRGGGKMAD